uniref:Class III aminotransferase n=1 Tax=uncultured Thiotrichaceae bacterium TaxID=298394 RepID=A0A6S6U7D2_9GAMM|nr:MAG: Class III aminotransferase [uncultured Thiotrichaceae bacterium]
MLSLPELMIAPNGARRTKVDHPELPVNIAEIVECARQCYVEGADGIHTHVRDANGKHVLDVGLYQELMRELARVVPDMTVQVTSEAAGIYQAEEQRAIIRELHPNYVSVAMREMLDDTANDHNKRQAQEFYQWANNADVTIQHIIYSAEDVTEWFRRVDAGLIPLEGNRAQLLFVLGRYRKHLDSQPEDLQPFIDAMRQSRGDYQIDWAVCAFGVAETVCLAEAVKQGGKIRIGFENSLWHANGKLAQNNAERVRYLKKYLVTTPSTVD